MDSITGGCLLQGRGADGHQRLADGSLRRHVEPTEYFTVSVDAGDAIPYRLVTGENLVTVLDNDGPVSTDTTPPVVAPHRNVIVERGGSRPAWVPFSPPSATDQVDGSLPALCNPAVRRSSSSNLQARRLQRKGRIRQIVRVPSGATGDADIVVIGPSGNDDLVRMMPIRVGRDRHHHGGSVMALLRGRACDRAPLSRRCRACRAPCAPPRRSHP